MNGLDSFQEMLASDYITDGGTLVIPENFWIWSDNTAVAALTIDVDNATIINNGNIIGRGGNGGDYGNGFDGGSAINITATNATITNETGAYIAGGGGGGATRLSVGGNSAGGGGAGGGTGGTADGPVGAVGGTIGTVGDTNFAGVTAAGAGGAGWRPRWVAVCFQVYLVRYQLQDFQAPQTAVLLEM